MSMTRVFLGLAALPFLAGVALAAPTQLTDRQMDKVAAGSDFYEEDDYNTSIVVISVHERYPFQYVNTVNSSAHPDTVTKCINVSPDCSTTYTKTNPDERGTNFIGGSVNAPAPATQPAGSFTNPPTTPLPSSSLGTSGGASPYYLLINNYALSVGAAFR